MGKGRGRAKRRLAKGAWFREHEGGTVQPLDRLGHDRPDFAAHCEELQRLRERAEAMAEQRRQAEIRRALDEAREREAAAERRRREVRRLEGERRKLAAPRLVDFADFAVERTILDYRLESPWLTWLGLAEHVANERDLGADFAFAVRTFTIQVPGTHWIGRIDGPQRLHPEIADLLRFVTEPARAPDFVSWREELREVLA